MARIVRTKAVFGACLVAVFFSSAACSDDSNDDVSSQDASDTAVHDVRDDAIDAGDATPDTTEDASEDATLDGGDTEDARDAQRDSDDDAAGDSDAHDAAVDTGPESVCGDDAVEGDEACDDGNTSDGDYCSADCSNVTGRCGDGTLQDNESCDDGQSNANCDTYHDGGDGTCVPPDQCSDGYVLDSGGGCVAAELDQHVHIYVTNTCQLSTAPTEIRVPRGQSLFVDWHNHSTSYKVDVWMSYGGGYTDLARGDTWDEPIEHCTNINRPYTEYADVTVSGFGLNDSSCPGHRLMIYCE